ncbi:thiopeptide-type bacteriocin biosynthesis protein [Streptomyces sp. NPDC127084]|uniref:thiopeptide-type bacteriocin biosynthesis protein n=1 Tax=Streptomyces sp. NPDC127084 TaxID=3347133 RepID=UPI00364E02B8
MNNHVHSGSDGEIHVVRTGTSIVPELSVGSEKPSREWLSFHVFYTASSRPLISQCIGPLVSDLRKNDLIHGYFFINYWLEGPHVRLRLLPSYPKLTAEVRERTENSIANFLRIRPALYEVTSDHLLTYYDMLFAAEYPETDRSPYLDANGRMRLRNNNTFTVEKYEPEYDRYGGRAGMTLAEWHFEQSSDLVVAIDRTMNVHLRSVRLGVSAQLMLVMATAFLGDTLEVVRFMDSYTDFWKRSFAGTAFADDTAHAHAFEADSTRVSNHLTAIHNSQQDGKSHGLPPFLKRWAEHSCELASRIRDASERMRFHSAVRNGNGEPLPVDRVLRLLLNSYLHMTNNRLSTTIGDECYLAFVIARSLEQHELKDGTP